MAISPGYQSKVIFYKDDEDLSFLMSSDNVTAWALDKQRNMADITPIASESYEFAPDASAASLMIRGYIDQEIDPGGFNNMLITVEVIPDQREAGVAQDNGTGKKTIFKGWVEKFRWMSSVDGANMFEATIRASGGVIESWRDWS